MTPNTINMLASSHSIEELNCALQKALLQYGITSYSFTYYSYHPKSLQELKVSFSSPLFTAWHQHYIAQHYNEIDTTLHEIYHETLPIIWDLSLQLKQAKTQREQQMRLDSIAFGITGGLSVPLHGPHDEFATLTLAQQKKELWIHRAPEIQYELQTLGTVYFYHLRKFLFHQTHKQLTLSKREQQCLSLTARRLTIDMIAKELNITARTVNFHLQNINKKLGTHNKYQSANIAKELGLF